MSLIGNPDTPASYVADYMQACVGIFGIPAGGFTADIEAYGAASEYNVESLYAALLNSTIGRSIYSPGASNTTLATKLIDKLGGSLLSTANKAAMIDLAKSMLDGGDSLAKVCMTFVEAVSNVSTTDPDFGAVAQQFANRIEIANYYTFSTSSPSSNLSALIAVLSSVNDTTDVSNPEQYLNNTNVTTGQTFTLTAGADLVTGTAADETIGALVVTNAQGNLTDSAQNVDIVDGGAGNDVMTIQTQSAAKLGMKISNVETINYTTYGGQEFDMANTTGATKLVNKNSIADLTLSNVGNLLDLSVESVSGNKTIVTYAAAAVAGSTDTQKLTFSGAANNHTVDLNDAGIETYEITSSGSANKVVLDDIGTQVKTIKVAGDQALTLAFLDTTGSVDAITSVDGSAATGKLTLDLATNVDASDMTVKGGSADDKVTIGNFTKDDNVDLGAGIDTVVINAADATTVASVKLANNEILQFAVNTDNDNAAEAYTYNLAGATELTTVKVGNSTANFGTVQTLTLSALAASAAALELNGNGAALDEDLNTVIWNLANSTGTADALAISVTNKDANGNLVNGTKGVQLTSAVTANGIETVSITTDQLHADTNATTQDGGLLLTLTADAVQTLNLTSATLLDINGSALGATVKKVDASAANGGVIVDMSAAEDSTTVGNGGTGTVNVTTGSGNDTVEKVLGKVLTTVNTGAGNDTVSLSAADIVKKVTINTGAGNDSIDLSGDTSAIEKNVTLGDGVDTVKIESDGTQTAVVITDFAAGSGGDILDLLDSANDIVVGGTGAITDYKEAASFANANAWGGMNVFTTLITSLTAADLETALETGGNGAITANDKFFVVASNGVDAGLFYIKDANAGVTIDTAEITLVGTFKGVSDASAFAVQNFADFLA